MTERDEEHFRLLAQARRGTASGASGAPVDAARRWLLGGVALAGVAGGAWFATHRHPSAELAPESLWSMSFDAPGGAALPMPSLRGKPLIINFWATWCPPCVREMPEIDRFFHSKYSKDIQLLGLAIDSPTPVRDFLARVKVSFPIGLAGLEGTELARQLGNERGGLPFTVGLDAAGHVVRRKLGETSYDELASWVGALT